MVGLAAILALGIAPFIHAQTFTDCNPLEKSCPENPALMAKSVSIDFTKTTSLPKDWTTENQGTLKYGPDGAQLIVAKSGDSLNLMSKFYVLFGSFEFKIKSAPGSGLISSIALISDARDEIDWEILGKEPDKIQSNYFGKGDDSDFTRGGLHDAPGNQQRYISYKIDWTPEYLSWSIDGQVVRKLAYGDAKGGTRYPQTPCRIKLGAWAGGDPEMNRPGTVEWAGKIDWSQGPFVMGLQSLNIVNSSPGSKYIYTDKSGSWQSIKVVDGESNSNGGAAPPPPPAPSTSEKPTTAPPSPQQTDLRSSLTTPFAATATGLTTAVLTTKTTASTTTLRPTTSAVRAAVTSAPVVLSKNAGSVNSVLGLAFVPAMLAPLLLV